MAATGSVRIRRLRLSARVNQFIQTLTHRHTDEIDQRIRELLDSDDEWSLVARLSPFDRAHHLRVHDALRRSGYTDRELLRAALLHDVGKANHVGRVRLWDRVMRVVGRKCCPQTWDRISRSQRRLAIGCYLAEHHALIGAKAVARAGGSERCCELVRRHEERVPTGDPMLDALIRADEAV